MARTTAMLRREWSEWGCREGQMDVIDFGPDRIRVCPPTTDAWTALAQVLAHHNYMIRTADTDSYSCRAITGASGLSLHAFGIALDVNWETNPFLQTPNRRKARFSRRRMQARRGADVRAGTADTDMTEPMIRDVRAIRTVDGREVFTWGGDWKTVKDAMHFHIDLKPAELARGIDWDTVAGDGAREPQNVFVRVGEVGADVEYYQRKLARLSAKAPGRIDGQYGPKTAASVAAFQRGRRPRVREGSDGELIGPWTKSELDLAEVERLLA